MLPQWWSDPALIRWPFKYDAGHLVLALCLIQSDWYSWNKYILEWSLIAMEHGPHLPQDTWMVLHFIVITHFFVVLNYCNEEQYQITIYILNVTQHQQGGSCLAVFLRGDIEAESSSLMVTVSVINVVSCSHHVWPHVASWSGIFVSTSPVCHCYRCLAGQGKTQRL